LQPPPPPPPQPPPQPPPVSQLPVALMLSRDVGITVTEMVERFVFMVLTSVLFGLEVDSRVCILARVNRRSFTYANYTQA
jgi:hypothetical protein